jgi:hypothetical protein
MATHPRDLTDSQKDLAAIVEHAAEEGTSQAIMLARKHDREDERHRTGYTPAPVSESSETIRGIAEKVFDDKIRGHRLDCMEPGGGLCEVGKKVDKILEVMSEQRGEKRVVAILRATGTAVALAVLGFVLNHFAARRSEESTKKQAEVAAVVEKKLATVEAAAKAMMPADVYVPMTKAGK